MPEKFIIAEDINTPKPLLHAEPQIVCNKFLSWLLGWVYIFRLLNLFLRRKRTINGEEK